MGFYKRVSIVFYLFVTSFSFSQTQNIGESFYLYKANSDIKKNKWILLLPGSSGLKIFNDSTFYKNKAENLMKLGYDVILIDHKKTYNIYNNDELKAKRKTGEKISWVIREAVNWVRTSNDRGENYFGHILGWSLAGEGIFNILNDADFIEKNKILSAALFYPSNNEKVEIKTTIPLLIQIGEKDIVLNQKLLKKEALKNDKIKLIIHQDSYHGFDIESLEKGETIKYPPVIGKKYLFLYNKESSNKATENLLEFLKQ
ncbi:dienelactone hydrolase family protein [Flavobacterium sp.]|uniref:dienelactone hydrolase family protein n=1 Tax=Flavobacterium sp. TaxID=239 RepID=UPI00374DC5B1